MVTAKRMDPTAKHAEPHQSSEPMGKAAMRKADPSPKSQLHRA